MTRSTPRVLITGGTGLLGSTLVATAPTGWRVVATYSRHPPPARWRGMFRRLDIRDESAVQRLIRSVSPVAVIHTASIGEVEEAERHPERVYEVNVGGAQRVGGACGAVGASLVFISSNAVFDGAHPPYTEDDPVRAVNRYGEFKIRAETWVRTQCPVPWAIIRPILMYGWPLPGGRGNVVTRWLEQLDRGQPVKVAEDLYTKPLLAEGCARAIWACLARQRTGIYHVAGADRLSLLEFARQTASVFGHDGGLVQPASPEWMRQFAPRPRDTSFATAKMEQELGVQPIGTREGLARMRRTRAARGPGGCRGAR